MWVRTGAFWRHYKPVMSFVCGCEQVRSCVGQYNETLHATLFMNDLRCSVIRVVCRLWVGANRCVLVPASTMTPCNTLHE